MIDPFFKALTPCGRRAVVVGVDDEGLPGERFTGMAVLDDHMQRVSSEEP